MLYMQITAAAVQSRSDTPPEAVAAAWVLAALTVIAFWAEGKFKKSQKVDDVIRVFLAVSLAGLASLIRPVKAMGRVFFNAISDVFVGWRMPEEWAQAGASFVGIGMVAIAILAFYKLQGKGGSTTVFAYVILFLGTYSLFATEFGQQFIDWLTTLLGVHVWNFITPGGA